MGYVVTTPELALKLEHARPYWTINSLAQAAGIAACANRPFVDKSRDMILADQRCMQEQLKQAGWQPLSSATIYFLLPMPNSNMVRQSLMKHGIMVRSCASYGLPDYLRLASRPARDVDRLLKALSLEVSS